MPPATLAFDEALQRRAEAGPRQLRRESWAARYRDRTPGYTPEQMRSRRGTLSAGLPACAPLPALIIGIDAMRHLGVSTATWLINIAVTVFGLLIWTIGRHLPPPRGRATRAFLAAAGIVTILLPFASEGMAGVHRWVSVAGLRLHASAIAAPLIILCVAAAASHRIGSALAISATGAMILALQPDAAQTTSFAAACTVVFVLAGTRRARHILLGATLMLSISAGSFLRHDPLPPVAHVEGIFDAVAARGPWSAATAAVALLLLPVPFFVAWYRHRRSTALALGVYVSMTLTAPVWGTYPVPVMGYGASPILGYFIALVVGVGRPSRIEEHAEKTWSLPSSA